MLKYPKLMKAKLYQYFQTKKRNAKSSLGNLGILWIKRSFIKKITKFYDSKIGRYSRHHQYELFYQVKYSNCMLRCNSFLKCIFSSPVSPGELLLPLGVRRPSVCLSLAFYILIFFSETTWSILSKLGMDVQWMVLYKSCVFRIDQKFNMAAKGR